MAVKYLGSRHEKLTPELAEEFAGMLAIPGERNFRPWRADAIRKWIANGLFHSPTWARAYWRGHWYRVNGQHTSRVLASMNGKFPESLYVQIVEYLCDDENDLALVFTQFDRPESKRGQADTMGVIMHSCPRLNKISKTAAMTAARAITAASNDGKGKAMFTDQYDACSVILDHKDFAIWVSKFYCFRHMRRTPILAAMHVTYEKDREDANAFWTMVQDDSHPDNTHPSRVLARFLHENAVVAKAQKKEKLVPRVYFVKCLHAWNAYRKNKTTDLKYHHKAPIPTIV